MPFDLDGEGEHFYVLVRKTGQNTRWVAKRIAERLGISYAAVGYGGLKDRHSVAEQWFSLHLPGQADPDPASLAVEGVEILAARRHRTKLRIGSVRANRFDITIRDLDGLTKSVDARLRLVKTGGVPNYFGAQRFGIRARNLDLVLDGPRSLRRGGREARSFGLSALRSALFNAFLAQRVRDGSWSRCRSGEIVYDAEAHSYAGDAYAMTGSGRQPTGLLWGRGVNQCSGPALAIEREFFAGFPESTRMLEHHGLRMSRRPLVLMPSGLRHQRIDDHLELSFTLGRGRYATSLLREILAFTDEASKT